MSSDYERGYNAGFKAGFEMAKPGGGDGQKLNVTLPGPAIVPQYATMPICGCRVGSACCNAACPHMAKVTCSASSSTSAN